MINFFYKFTPYILASLGVALALCGYLLDKQGNHLKWLWSLVVLMQIVSGLVCGRLIQRLYQGVYTDSLTGLWNRRYFQHKLNEELKRTDRSDAPLCIAMIDVDDFKRVNDNYGHAAGDEVLKMLGLIYQRNLRAIDTVTRWGGDEFAIIFPETTLKGAMRVAERIRRVVAGSLERYNITISIGVVVVNEIDACQVMLQADRALYQAKQTKNLVVMVPQAGAVNYARAK